MKKYLIILFIALLSCEDSNKEITTVKLVRTTSKIESTPIYVVEYEGCEYITMFRKFSHKGNCKNKIHCYNEIN